HAARGDNERVAYVCDGHHVCGRLLQQSADALGGRLLLAKHYRQSSLDRFQTLMFIDPILRSTLKHAFPRLFVKPADVRTLFFSRSGSDSNNGSATSPLKTFPRGFEILKNAYGSVIEGRWRFQATAGSYPEPVNAYGLRSQEPIGIFGPNVGVNVQ